MDKDLASKIVRSQGERDRVDGIQPIMGFSDKGIPLYSRSIIFSAMDFEVANAYWINHSGKIRPVLNTHIDDVVDSPVSFGLTDNKVQEVYEKYGEALRVEGKARDEIIKNLCFKGWIRIRYYQAGNYYSIDVGKLNSRTREYLYQWAYKELESVNNHRFSGATIFEFSSGISSKFDMNDLVNEALLNAFQKGSLVMDYLVPVHSNADFLDLAPAARMESNIKSIIKSGVI